MNGLIRGCGGPSGARSSVERERHILTVATGCLSFALLLSTFPSSFAVAQETTSFDAPAIDSAHAMGMAHRGQSFIRPRGIAVDAEHGEVIVANTGLGRIEFFDFATWPRGFFEHRVQGADGHPRTGEPVSVAVDRDGRIFIADLVAAYVDVVDFRGRPLARLDLPAPDDSASGETGAGVVATGPDGRIYVGSRGKHGRIHVFDRELRHVATWGEAGREPGQLEIVSAIAADRDGRLYVVCATTTHAVQNFDAGGRFQFGFGAHDLGPGNFSLPSGITLTEDGRVWVSDAIRQIVQVFDSGGKYLGAVGGIGIRPGEFREPSALAGDGHGLLALTEKSGGRFQVLWLR
jgi:sugar lactone lactonase YvrE